ncbi:M48 family metallopeptidase [Streptomyces sp. MUM 203J]|uniref:M48 family metallopeptidase n=1 Tax=Streptomyces sp. MUM 203J TaxID=2791990 RepID=UPI001F043F08|nr:M48 family metallopeptidase [Streptomyces sp. MUM 203J]
MWCAACDWNVDPAQPEEEPGRLQRLRRALAQQHGERLLAEVTADGNLRPHWDTPTVLAYAIALVVHALTAALVVGGTLLVVLGWGTALPVLGAFLLAMACLMRPRFPRLPGDVPVLFRQDAPRLFALIDEVAAVVGTRGVDAVAVTADVNASVTTYGVRGRRVLTLGLGLWEIITPQERIALLGHELGHYSNGDTRRGLILWHTMNSLDNWRDLLARIHNPNPIEVFVNLVYAVPRGLLLGLLMLLDQLTLRASQRSEYLSDMSAGRAGSTEAAVGLMDRLLVAASAESVLLRESNARQVVRRGGTGTPEDPPQALWDRLRAHVESIPESEYERQRRAGVLRGHSVDDTHPPTHLRRTRLLTAPALPPAVATDTARESAITSELAAPRATIARAVLRGTRPWACR